MKPIFSILALVLVLLQVSNCQLTINYLSLSSDSSGSSTTPETSPAVVDPKGTAGNDSNKMRKEENEESKEKNEDETKNDEGTKDQKEVEQKQNNSRQANQEKKKLEKEQRDLERKQRREQREADRKKKQEQKEADRKNKREQRNLKKRKVRELEARKLQSEEIFTAAIIDSDSNENTQNKDTRELNSTDYKLSTEQSEIFYKASRIKFAAPTSFTTGQNSSVIGISKDLESMIAREEKEISQSLNGFAAYNVTITSKTKELLLETDNTIDLDKKYANQVITAVEKLDVEERCSRELMDRAGSLLVNFQSKNDALYSKSLLITKLLNKNRSNEFISKEEQEAEQSLKYALDAHQKTIQTRSSYIIDLSAVLLACKKKVYIPKQIVCIPTRYYLPDPKKCTTEDLVKLVEEMIFLYTMRFTENSYLQTCSDKISYCEEHCSSGDSLCLDCFNTSFCKKVHLYRKHYYGKKLVQVANRAYECETYLYFMLMNRSEQSVSV
ncbi:uncharacterized protein cubi_01696 [Cryptosporidium ubiquitum]|uniref:Uncharacterized protein n=1 Tax=Cryptosporidium ubiquitum TaxID=857276 RepID=A0A1J4MEC3_9CRYT|nr:uncharacterized protein cubi_01696 [Cryptosporidium ubiquitum]OII71221.1 hypothetical protein cubi_01696 [Cryptosporidium ubiquitum]